MAIQLISSREAAVLHGIKVLVYGGAGGGKTRLCSTTGGNAIVISAEAGLLSLREFDLPVLQIKTMQDMYDAYAFCHSGEGRDFDWVCIDSISEIAEVVLSTEKKATKDPRKAYGELQDQMMDLLRAWRDLPGRNVYMSAKMERVKDETSGANLYSPMMPGTKLGQQIPYLFDEVFALRVERGEDGEPVRAIQTSPDFQYTAKDRSGALSMWEPPDLSAIAKKIRGREPPAASPEAA